VREGNKEVQRGIGKQMERGRMKREREEVKAQKTTKEMQISEGHLTKPQIQVRSLRFSLLGTFLLHQNSKLK
jgi:hypothetical protein